MTGTPAPAITIEETETAWVFTLADNTSFTIPKAEPEVPFAIVLEVEPGTSLLYDEKMSIPYSVSGVEEGDEITMDVLNIVPNYNGIEYEIIPANEGNFASGKIELTCKQWTFDDMLFKVFVYAANGKGKTDIKCIATTVKAVEAVFDAKLVDAGEQTIQFDFKANEENLKVVTDVDWITLEPATKANFEWHGSVIVAANETNVYRNGHVKVVYTWDENQVFMDNEFEILQEPATDKATSISYIKNSFEDGKEGVKANHLTVIAAGKKTAVVTDGSESSNTYKYLILENVATQLEVGKVYDFVGTVVKNNTDRNDTWLTDVTATEVTGVEPVEWNFMDNYQYMNSTTRFRTTIIYGVLEKENDIYCIKNLADENCPFIIDDAPFALDELVGKTVFLNAYKLYYHRYTDVTPYIYDIHVIATEAKVVNFTPESSVKYLDDDLCFYSKISSPDNVNYWSWCKNGYPEDSFVGYTEDDVKVFMQSQSLNLLQNIAYSTIEEYIQNTTATGVCSYNWQVFNGQVSWLALEIGEDGFPTGQYLIKTDARKIVPYEYYLDTWKVQNDYWTITEKEKGVSYNVTGICNTKRSQYNEDGEKIVIEALYDAKTGAFTLASQEIAPPYERGNSVLTDYLTAEGYVDGNWQIAPYEKVGETMLNVTLRKVSVDDDEFMYFVPTDLNAYTYLCFATHNITDNYMWGTWGTNWTYIRYTRGYRDVTPDPADAYSAWIGQWKLGDDTITISPKEVNETLLMSGFGEKDVEQIVFFDTNTGNIEFKHVRSGITYKQGSRYYEYYGVGQDENDAFVWGDNNTVATFAMQEDGSATIVPTESFRWVSPYGDIYGSSWSMIGTFYGGNWDSDRWMTSDGTWMVARSVWFNEGDMFKFRYDGDWDQNLGGTFVALGEDFALEEGGSNITVPYSGSYDILLNPETKVARIVEAQDDIKEAFVVNAVKFGVAGYNAAGGWDVESAVMFELPGKLLPDTQTTQAAMAFYKAQAQKLEKTQLPLESMQESRITRLINVEKE